MVPRTIGGLDIVGIIGTDGDVVTYAGDHPEHGTVAVTILSSSAASHPGASEEYLAECARRAEDPVEADFHVSHGVDDGIPFHITRIQGATPTIHSLPPPVNRVRRLAFLTLTALALIAVIMSVFRTADVVTLSPDERSWAVDLDGDWERTEGDEPLALIATAGDGVLVVSGSVRTDAPNAEVALALIRDSLATARSAVDVEPFDEPWVRGLDVVGADGADRLIRIVERPCAAFVLTVESTEGAFTDEVAESATGVSATFRRIGVPPAFEKGADAPDGFEVVVQNGIRLALPEGSLVDANNDEPCLSAQLAGQTQSVSVNWTAGEDEASHLSTWEADIDAAGGSVLSAAVTARGKQRRVAATDRGSLVLYAVEDDSGVYSLAFSVPGVAELGASDLVVFDLIASTFEVTGTSEDPS